MGRVKAAYSNVILAVFLVACLTGVTFEKTALAVDWKQACKRLQSLAIHDVTLIASVASNIKQRSEFIESLTFGKEWLNYLDGVLSQGKYKRKRYKVKNIGEVKRSITWMNSELEKLKVSFSRNSSKKKIRNYNEAVIGFLARTLNQMAGAEFVARSDLYNAGLMFSRVAEYVAGDNNPYVEWQTTTQTIQRMLVTESYLNQTFGELALLIPTPKELTFNDFLQMEGMGVVPFGLAVEKIPADGALFGPKLFFDHDARHYFQRFSTSNRRDPYISFFTRRGPIDLALYSNNAAALDFYKETVLPNLQSLKTQRQKALAIAVLFSS